MENTTNQTNELKQQIMGLSSLVQLENKSRQVKTIKEFGFFITNDTKRLINYHQAVFFLQQAKGLTLDSVSGVPNLETTAPYIKWLKKLSRKLLRKMDDNTCQTMTENDLPNILLAGWKDWVPSSAIWCPLKVNGEFLGGLWITRDDTWQESEIGLLSQLRTSYAHSLLVLKAKPRWWNPKINIHPIKALFKIAVIAALFSSLFIPIQLSVLAPAKITTQNPLIVTSPLNGVIHKIHVQPNQEVRKGDLLFSLDDTELRNRHNVAQKALEVVKAEHKRSRQKFLLQADKGSDVDLLKARVASKSAEVAFAAEELNMVDVKAVRDGITIINDINDLVGKPVVIGEKIITLADPGQKELEIHVPVENAINLAPGAKVQMFLNNDPSLEISGTIRRTSYEAEITEEQILAFIVKAELTPDSPPLRIGLRGTAKIFGKTTPLYYYLFRRPLASFRRAAGI